MNFKRLFKLKNMEDWNSCNVVTPIRLIDLPIIMEERLFAELEIKEDLKRTGIRNLQCEQVIEYYEKLIPKVEWILNHSLGIAKILPIQLGLPFLAIGELFVTS